MIEDYMAIYFAAWRASNFSRLRASALALAEMKDQPTYFTQMWRTRANWAVDPLVTGEFLTPARVAS
jgi:hypothetical protein